MLWKDFVSCRPDFGLLTSLIQSFFRQASGVFLSLIALPFDPIFSLCEIDLRQFVQ